MSSGAAAAEQRRPDVSVVVVSFNVRDLLAACLRSVERESDGLVVETIVVDNASADGSADMVARRFPSVTLIRNDLNRWLAPATNQALARCRGRYVMFLSPDAELRPGALRELKSFLDANSDVGIVGAQLLNSDGSLQPSGNPLRSGWSFIADSLPLQRLGLRAPQGFRQAGRDYEEVCRVDEVCGAASLVRREVLETVGFLDERMSFSYEDVDLCIRAARAGWRIMYDPRAKVVHHGGRSVPTDAGELLRRWEAGQLVFIRKHYPRVLYWVVRALIAARRLARPAVGALRTAGTAR
jgi:GT2 family glycosyltransferase